MCGILGLWQGQGKSIDLASVQRATGRLRHRGPDDEGYLLVATGTGEARSLAGADTMPELDLPAINSSLGKTGDLAFGFRRLAILDLSAAGHQPMSSADGRCWIIFNGEIYNYVELRHQLESYGHRFHTATDTEVILAAYQQWGHDCLAHFIGMWAFALWDRGRRELFCARDRFGIKPFYYFWEGQNFAFASEIKALLELPGVPRRPNEAIIYDYLYEGALDHTDETFFGGLAQLRPAHYLLLHEQRLQIRRYWDLDSSAQAEPATDAQYAEKFYALFEEAVRLHLRSDVPIGTCLSGGLDSSAIVCVANKLLFGERAASPQLIGRQQKTFSAYFEDERLDERKYIELVLAATGAEANYTFPGSAAWPEALPRLLWHQEEPFGSTSIYAQWAVMEKAAERGVKVLLDGQGADELLAGYPGYFSSYWASLMQQSRWAELHREISAYRRVHGVSLTRMALRLARFYAPPRLSAFIDRSRHEKALGLNRDFLRQYHGRRHASSRQYDRDPFHNHLYDWLARDNLPQLLRYEDRNAMAFSIEARVPFLDHRLVEYVFSLPANQKINAGLTKAVFRRALRHVIPEPIRRRRDKIGFVTPEKIWLQEAQDWRRELLASPSFRARGYFDVPQILAALQPQHTGQHHLKANVWRWLNLELWFRKMIDRP